MHTHHGDVQTPAFVPLASRAVVKSLLPQEVRDLGFQMVLGNAFHLELNPGSDQIASRGGLHRFMDWEGAIITDSGGFQVFSMGHGRVADEIKGSRSQGRSLRQLQGDGGERVISATQDGSSSMPGGNESPGKSECESAEHGEGDIAGSRGGGHGAVLAIDEEGVRFRSYIDGSEMMIGPEKSMAIQAALGSDVALAFDECTPYHVSRDYTARSMERTHRWLDRCIDWHRQHASPNQSLFGIVQGGTYEDLRQISAERVVAAGVDGVAIGGSLGREKTQMYEVVSWAAGRLPGGLPRHLLGIGEVDDLLEMVALGVDLFDCAMPTRLARHGMALVPNPGKRWRLDLTKSGPRDEEGPLVLGCNCHACSRFSRAYLAYLFRVREMTGIRLLTMHNLNFMARLMEGARASIQAGTLTDFRGKLHAGAPPWVGRSARTAKE